MNQRKLALSLGIALVCASILLAAYSLTLNSETVTSPLPRSFTANGRTFSITFTASTQAQREQGLMNTKITTTTIMLFAWPSPGYYQFWMYQTNSSLDMMWVESSGDAGRIVYLVSGAPPCYDSSKCAVYTPTAPANFVLEARAGFAEANGLTVGTTLQFS